MNDKGSNDDVSSCWIDLSEYETVDETPILEAPSRKNRMNPPLSPKSARSLGALAPVIFSESDEESEGPTIDLTESKPIKTEHQESDKPPGTVLRYLKRHFPKRLQELYNLKQKNVELCHYCFAYIHQVIDDHLSPECPHRPLFGYRKEAWVYPWRSKKRRDDPEWLAKHPRTGTPRDRFAKKGTFYRRLQPQPFASPPVPHQQPTPFNDRFGSVQHSGGVLPSPQIGAFHMVQFNSALHGQQFGGAFQSLPKSQQFGGLPHGQHIGSRPQNQQFSSFNANPMFNQQQQQLYGRPSYGAQFPPLGPSHSFAGASVQYPQYVLHQEYFSDALVDRLATEVGRRLSTQKRSALFNSHTGFAPK